MYINCIGKGVVNAIAQNCNEFIDCLEKGQNGIKLIENREYNTTIEYAAYIKERKAFDYYIKKAFLEAKQDANITDDFIRGNNRVGVILGSSLGDASIYSRKCIEKDYTHMTNAMGEIKELYKIKGPMYVVSNTCVSGVNAILIAMKLIELGMIDICFVGGCDIISDYIISGLESMNALSDNAYLSPFSKNRNGMILGEGAGFLVLSKSAELRDEDKIKIKSGFVSNDASHLTAPERNGKGLKIAINESLKMAKVIPEEIDCVFCCGNGTVYNDEVQAKVINDIWVKKHCDVLVTSVKPYIGHSLGASGVIECIGMILMMERNILIPISEKTDYDDTIPRINLLHKKIRRKVNNAILLSVGFSGTNGALIIGR